MHWLVLAFVQLRLPRKTQKIKHFDMLRFTCARAIATEFVDAIDPNEETEPPGEVRP